MSRMMQNVPTADVVVTNPTHFAVALRYRGDEMGAPKVIAKGQDLIAQRIKQIARENNVPVVENKPLARALYAAVEVDQEIPYDLFQGVAQILAYIYSLKRDRAVGDQRGWEPDMAKVMEAPAGGRQLQRRPRADDCKQSDVLLAVAMAVILGVMIVPLPEIILDLLIIVNVAAALMVLLVSMYTTHPLQFSSFPALLLVLTLFRLALNVAASRLILLQGHAGEVIAAFGDFVVGGSYVVGIVIFLILIVIQFVVITNGAGRVAEVAARFTLDSMPGKQMAIDADLSAGAIDETTARARRKEVTQEADFYGSMDGASKFVKGDAIAGIIIIVVNILGGSDHWRAPARHARPDRPRQVHPPDRRRRPGLPDPGPADLHRHGHHRDPLRFGLEPGPRHRQPGLRQPPRPLHGGRRAGLAGDHPGPAARSRCS